MDVLNLAHGTFYLVGAYVGLTILKVTGNFWLALIIAPSIVAALGYLVEVLVIRPVYARGHLDQVLLTLGLAYIMADQARGIWGAQEEALAAPALLTGSMSIAGLTFPLYRLFVIAFGLAAALALWILIERTRVGAMIRAGVSNRTMARNLGINIGKVFAHTFAFGCGLAALAGVVAGPIIGVAPGLDAEILMLALIVVVTGGLGSLSGSFWGSILIGQADTYGKTLFPQFSQFFIFGIMALVLLYRPGGLMGKPQL
jgi:branched-subunit amino acid ABC-type transport system permease component